MKSPKVGSSNAIYGTENRFHINYGIAGKSAAAHIDLMNLLEFKSNDMQIQYDDNYSVYHKGEETSYGDKGTKDTLLKSYGVKIKRQNGDEITDKETAQVKTALDSVYSVFGNKSEMARKFGLKISHSGLVGMHARKAVGLFFPSYKAIGVSFSASAGLTLAHEWAHFMDHYVGHQKNNWHNSDDWNSTAGQIAVNLRSKLKNATKYSGRTCECFARSMEAYYAYKLNGDAGLSDVVSSGEEYFPNDSAYMKREVIPLCEKWLKENEELLKSMKVKLVLMNKSSKLSESMKHEGKYKDGMKKTWTQEEEDEGMKVEMEHTDDKEVARQIAMDHLIENHNYYKDLAKMEAKEKSE
jgi:hypothetical protein